MTSLVRLPKRFFGVVSIASLFYLLIWCLPAHSVGESAVITLVFPWGARTNAMGEVGTALCDDGAAAFYNPAGLGIPNSRWEGGAFTHFYEPILPQFGLRDLWHTTIAGHFQYTDTTFGRIITRGFGGFFNYLNLGENEWTDEFGRPRGSGLSHEFVLGVLSYGTNVHRENLDLAMGFSAKYVKSARAPGYGEAGAGIGRTVAFDLGLLMVTDFGLRVGMNAANMGLDIYYVDPNDPDPLPFTVNLAVGYKRLFTDNNIKIFQLASEFRLERELVVNKAYEHPDPFYKAIVTDTRDKSFAENWRITQKHIGWECLLFNTGALRMGCLHDNDGYRYELHVGTGFQIFNHFEMDWYGILVPHDTQHPPHGQWGMSFTMMRLGLWSEDDAKWVLVDPSR